MSTLTLPRRLGPLNIAPLRQWRATTPAASEPGLDWLDCALVCLFLIGLYTNFTVQISTKVPFPSAPSGIAGLILLWRRRNRISVKPLAWFLIVVALYLASMLSADDITYLNRRTNGLIQLTYSLTIGFALFLTVTQARPGQIATLFLVFALVIAVGCLLEAYGGLRPVSDAVRKVIYSRGVYENDLRDVLLYHRVRPKFFASEPSSVTFCYALLCFLWMVISRWRWKLLLYVGLVALGLFAMPGPTLLLMLVLLLPYMLCLASRKRGRLNPGRLLLVACVSAAALAAFAVLASALFPTRLNDILSGNDPSFFYRVLGPGMAGIDIVKHFPFAGAGLTGEPFIEERVTNLYVRSPAYSAHWEVVSPATELLINYFWLHWVYLGLVWGLIMFAALSMWLRALHVPSVAFVWISWAIMGQASGAYVGPTCWAVFFLTGAAAVLYQRGEQPTYPYGERPSPRSPPRLRLLRT
jgi:hypothetical protein